MTWFGATPEDRRRTLGLIGTAIVLSPLIVAAEVMRALHVPFLRGQTWRQAWREEF